MRPCENSASFFLLNMYHVCVLFGKYTSRHTPIGNSSIGWRKKHKFHWSVMVKKIYQNLSFSREKNREICQLVAWKYREIIQSFVVNIHKIFQSDTRKRSWILWIYCQKKRKICQLITENFWKFVNQLQWEKMQTSPICHGKILVNSMSTSTHCSHHLLNIFIHYIISFYLFKILGTCSSYSYYIYYYNFFLFTVNYFNRIVTYLFSVCIFSKSIVKPFYFPVFSITYATPAKTNYILI